MKICFVTGTRAEYGLLHPLIQRVRREPSVTVQIIATCMHLAPEFGSTYRDIERDGLTLDAKVEMLVSSDTPMGTVKSMGLGLIGLADAYDRLAPDLIVLLGDRFEAFCAAAAALVAGIPVAHIQGGELTEGAMDDAMRHCITKMASLHFVAAEAYRDRVIQLGEEPGRVHDVGALGLDNVLGLDLIPGPRLREELGLPAAGPLFLLTFHPETWAAQAPVAQLEQVLRALDLTPEAFVVATLANADPGGRALNAALEAWCGARPERALLTPSLGQLRYLSLLKEAALVLGNSSSGILEAPSLGTPTVNVGDRQKGRLRAPCVLDCPCETAAIRAAMARALDPAFRADPARFVSPYGDGQAAERIWAVLRDAKGWTARKTFFDLPPRRQDP